MMGGDSAGGQFESRDTRSVPFLQVDDVRKNGEMVFTIQRPTPNSTNKRRTSHDLPLTNTCQTKFSVARIEAGEIATSSEPKTTNAEHESQRSRKARHFLSSSRGQLEDRSIPQTTVTDTEPAAHLQCDSQQSTRLSVQRPVIGFAASNTISPYSLHTDTKSHPVLEAFRKDQDQDPLSTRDSLL
jgi:hypothetical protein